MYYAFFEPFPLRNTPLHHSPLLISENTSCCASRSPHVSNASRARLPKKKEARPRTRTSEAQRHKPTAAELSKQISKSIGLDIIRSDFEHIYSFFRSFVKVKTVHHNEEKSSQLSDNRTRGTESEHDSEASIKEHGTPTTISSHSRNSSYAPKSKLGEAVASNYVAARGSVDRTMESLSLLTQSFLSSMIVTAGNTICLIIEAGQKAFPALNFYSAKSATQQMIEHGWNPLKSFEWQTAALSDTRKLSEYRRERVEFVKGYLSGKSDSPWTQTLTFASRSVSATFSVLENVSPILIQGASRFVSAGYGGLKALGHWGTLGSEAGELEKDSPHAFVSIRAGFAFLDELPSLPSSSAKASVRETKELPTPRKDSAPENERSSKHIKLSSFLLPNGMKKTTLPTSGKNYANHKRQNNELGGSGNPGGLLKKGGAVLGAGMLLMATSGVSLPAAVTCSAILITTVGVAQAKAAVNDNNVHQEARAAFRRSQSVRRLEKAILPRRRESTQQLIKKKHNDMLEVSHVKQALSAQGPSELRLRHNVEDLEAYVETTTAVDVDVETYAVGSRLSQADSFIG